VTLDASTLRNFVAQCELTYMPVPYHNSLHGADVMQATAAMLCSMRQSGHPLTTYMTPTETLSLLLAAIIHDLGHPYVVQL
jgi:hypothetical protein